MFKRIKQLPRRIRPAVIVLVAAALILCANAANLPARIEPSWQRIFSSVGLKSAPDDTNFVRFLDVGQGDCSLIKSGNRLMLVDTGDLDHGEAVVDAVKSLGFDSVDTVLITHPHSDHIGGLATLIERVAVGRVIMCSYAPDSSGDLAAYRRVAERCEQLGVAVEPPLIGETSAFGEFTLRVLGCDADAADENDRSIVLRVDGGDSSFLLMGDAGSGIEKSLISQGLIDRCDVLKAGHHGSATSTSSVLLRTCEPKYVIFSCGDGNRFSHPSDAAISRVKQSTAQILRTDANGSITFYLGAGLAPDTEF